MARSFLRASSQRLTYTGSTVTGYPFTMAAWAYPTTLTAGTNYNVFSIGRALTSNNGLGLALNTSALPTFYHTNDTGSATAVANGPIAARVNAWVPLLGIAYSATDHRVLSPLGMAVSSTSVSFTTMPDRVTVGTYGGGSFGDYFDGGIAKCAIWRTALDWRSVQAYIAGANPLTIAPGALLAYWPVGGMTSPELDVVGGRQMTLTNAPVFSPDPPQLYPSRRRVHLNVPAVFMPSWALGANTLLGGSAC